MPLLQVLPLVEAFFVMCDARTLPQTQPSSPLQSAMSAEFPLGATPGPSTMEPASQQTPSSRQHAHGGASAPSQPIAEPHVPFLRFVSLFLPTLPFCRASVWSFWPDSNADTV